MSSPPPQSRGTIIIDRIAGIKWTPEEESALLYYRVYHGRRNRSDPWTATQASMRERFHQERSIESLQSKFKELCTKHGLGSEATTGDASTGGTVTGGASTGGASTGGASTGGASTGGASTGGASNVGDGGSSAGGSSVGGASVGGASVGGASVGGGVSTGDASSADASTGDGSYAGADAGTVYDEEKVFSYLKKKEAPGAFTTGLPTRWPADAEDLKFFPRIGGGGHLQLQHTLNPSGGMKVAPAKQAQHPLLSSVSRNTGGGNVGGGGNVSGGSTQSRGYQHHVSRGREWYWPSALQCTHRRLQQEWQNNLNGPLRSLRPILPRPSPQISMPVKLTINAKAIGKSVIRLLK